MIQRAFFFGVMMVLYCNQFMDYTVLEDGLFLFSCYIFRPRSSQGSVRNKLELSNPIVIFMGFAIAGLSLQLQMQQGWFSCSSVWIFGLRSSWNWH